MKVTYPVELEDKDNYELTFTDTGLIFLKDSSGSSVGFGPLTEAHTETLIDTLLDYQRKIRKPLLDKLEELAMEFYDEAYDLLSSHDTAVVNKYARKELENER